MPLSLQMDAVVRDIGTILRMITQNALVALRRHGDASDLSEADKPSISRQDASTPYGVGNALAGRHKPPTARAV